MIETYNKHWSLLEDMYWDFISLPQEHRQYKVCIAQLRSSFKEELGQKVMNKQVTFVENSDFKGTGIIKDVSNNGKNLIFYCTYGSYNRTWFRADDIKMQTL